jgi:hypothetical protein
MYATGWSRLPRRLPTATGAARQILTPAKYFKTPLTSLYTFLFSLLSFRPAHAALIFFLLNSVQSGAIFVSGRPNDGFRGKHTHRALAAFILDALAPQTQTAADAPEK